MRLLSVTVCILAITLGFQGRLFAQKNSQAIIDSLELALSKLPDNTAKLVVYEKTLQILFNERAYKDGFDAAIEALALAERLKDKEKQAFFNYILGLMSGGQGKNQSAIDYFNIALERYRAIGNKNQLTTTLNKIGIIYERLNEYKKAIEAYGHSLQISEELLKSCDERSDYKKIRETEESMARTTNGSSFSYLRLGDNVKAIETAIHAVDISERLLETAKTREESKNAKTLIAQARRSLANAYTFQGTNLTGSSAQNKYHLAIENGTRSRNLLKELISEGFQHNESIKYQQAELGFTLNSLATSYYYSGKYNESLESYNLALDIQQKLNDQIQIGLIQGNMGNIFKELGEITTDYDSSISFYSAAKHHWGMSLKISEIFQDKSAMAGTLNNFGIVYNLEKKFDSAIIVLKKALKLGEEIGHKEWIKFSLDILADSYAGVGDYKSAYEYNQKFASIKDSLLNDESARQISELQTRYEAEKKDNAIINLSKEKSIQELRLKEQQALLMQQTLIATQNENDLLLVNNEKAMQQFELEKRSAELSKKRIEVSLLNKDKAFQAELLKNTQKNRNMMIAALLGLFLFSGTVYYFKRQKKELVLQHKITETELNLFRSQMNPHFMFNALNSIHSFVVTNDTDKAASYLEKFSQLMRTILENSTNNLVTLADDLKALDLYLELESERLAHRFSYEIKIDDTVNPNKVMVPPMILQPFLENSVWHGMQSKDKDGKIQLHVGKTGELLHCTITDNGKGFRKSAVVDNRSKKSYGINITRQRIENLNKTHKVNGYCTVSELFDEHRLPAGVKVEVGLPLELEG